MIIFVFILVIIGRENRNYKLGSANSIG